MTIKIFGSTTEVNQASNTLLRLAELDSVLLLNRAKTLELFANLWTEVEEKLAHSFTAAHTIFVQNLPRLGRTIHQIYKEKVSTISKPEEISQCLRQMQKDISAVIIPPCRQSFRGNKGPTLLVHYQRNKSHSYVLKWTDELEVRCNWLYHAFATNFNHDSHLNPISGFQVPTLSSINFETKIHELPSGDKNLLTPEICSKLQKKFLRITEIYHGDPISKNVLMLSQRIDGENLFDFIQTRYRLLTPDYRKKFFNRLGRLGMLDVVAGNLDRLVQIYIDRDGEYTLQDLEANLGNVMVVWSKDDESAPLLFAIDNGVDSKLVSNDTERKKYLSFLQKLFSSSNLEELLAQNMLTTFQNAIKTQIDDMSTGNVVELRQQFELFSKELVSIGYPAFRQGIEEMHFHLYATLIPGWEKEALALSIHPQLLEAINERMNTIKATRRRL